MNETSPLHDAKVDGLEIHEVQVSTHHAELKSGAAIVAELLNDCETDCDSLAAIKLRQKYPAEAHSHMNMLARRKTHGALVHETFVKFRSFLRLMGPVPEPGYTLDRLNSADPEYAPGKVRWASKQEQAVNKQNVILLTGTNGVVRPLTEWAKLLKISANTLRSRRANGWTDVEVLYGKQSTIAYAKTYAAKYRAASVFPWPPELGGDWEGGYRRDRWNYARTGRPETRAAFLVRKLTARKTDYEDRLNRNYDPDDDTPPTEAEIKLMADHDTCTRIVKWALTLRGAACGPWIEPKPRWHGEWHLKDDD